ncbi:hypothetical protein ACHAQA_000476 [Verticillium albo-atrum]
MSETLYHATTVTRDLDASVGEVWAIVAGFGCERLWFPHVKKLSLEGFGIGSVRTFTQEGPGRPFRIFTEELTSVDAAKHTIRFRVRRPDYPDMIAYGTNILDSLGPNKTRFRWVAEVNLEDEEQRRYIKEELDVLFDDLVIAVGDRLA